MVSVDENAAMEIVIGHLAERGIASVAYMAGKEISFESAELFTMFHTQMRAHHLATETEWNKFGDRSVQRGFNCAMRLFSEPLVQPEARGVRRRCDRVRRDGGVAFAWASRA